MPTELKNKPLDDDRLVQLILQYQDQVIGPEDLAQLSTALEIDEHAQRVYISMCYQDGMLCETLRPQEIEVDVEMDQLGADLWAATSRSLSHTNHRLARRRFRPLSLVPYAMAASLVAALIVALVWQSTHQGGPVAHLVRTVDAEWANGKRISDGMALAKGSLILRSGLAEIEFGSGARVVLEGPATFEIQSGDLAFLHRGMLSATVPPRAIGFTIVTPDSRVVDLGTEFGVQVEDNGLTEIHVFKGKVEAGVGQSGHSMVEIETNEALRLASRATEFSKIRAYPERFMRDLGTSKLSVSSAYRAAIVASKPILYWDFESVEDRVVGNRMGPSLSGDVNGTVMPAGHGNHVLICSKTKTDKRASVVLTEPMTALGGKRSYTIEFWFYADQTHHGTILALLSKMGQAESGAPGQVGFIELLPKNVIGQVGKYGREAYKKIRFTHRSVPGHGGTRGSINAISPRRYLTHRWYHTVAVKEGSQMWIYLNGRRILAETDQNTNVLPSDMWFEVGRMIEGGGAKRRHFAGRIDEIAIYDRALGSDEVARHHALMGMKVDVDSSETARTTNRDDR